MYVQLGVFDQPVLQLPWPLGFLLGSVSVDHIKLSIRSIFSLVIVAVLVRSLWTQQQPDAAWERVLRYLLELESRQSRLWSAMEERVLTALQNMRRSRSCSHDGEREMDIIAHGHSTGQVVRFCACHPDLRNCACHPDLQSAGWPCWKYMSPL